jgi:hypothetical protein
LIANVAKRREWSKFHHKAEGLMTRITLLRSSSARRTAWLLAAGAASLLLVAAPANAQTPGGGPQVEFATELTMLNLTTPTPVPLPLGAGWTPVQSNVTVTLSSQRLVSPGPRSFGAACATPGGGGPTGAFCQPTGNPPPINPLDLDGETMSVNSFFDVIFDVVVVDVDAGNDYAGQGPGGTFMVQDLTDPGTRDMATI